MSLRPEVLAPEFFRLLRGGAIKHLASLHTLEIEIAHIRDMVHEVEVPFFGWDADEHYWYRESCDVPGMFGSLRCVVLLCFGCLRFFSGVDREKFEGVLKTVFGKGDLEVVFRD